MMLGPLGYAAGAAVAASLAFGGYQTIRAKTALLGAERAATEARAARGELATCAARLTNIQEAAASNASIPDDLREFEVPPAWLIPEGGQ